jgi:hypothetical protein
MFSSHSPTSRCSSSGENYCPRRSWLGGCLDKVSSWPAQHGGGRASPRHGAFWFVPHKRRVHGDDGLRLGILS